LPGLPWPALAVRPVRPSSTISCDAIRRGAATVIQLGELMMILELHRPGTFGQGNCAAHRPRAEDGPQIHRTRARATSIRAAPSWPAEQAAPYLEYLRERVSAFPDLSAVRLTREIRERGYKGAYTAVKGFLAAIRPESEPKPYEVRFETPPGYQAPVDFARFVTTFTDEPGLTRIVWLYSLVLGHSRQIFARFVMHQDLQTLLR
jgi:hypothetical protein